MFLQHPRERRVPIGTARMAHLSLPNSELHEGVIFEQDARIQALVDDPTTAVLFPGGDACAPDRLPGLPVRSLIVVDGTWSQAKKVLRVNPRLASVRRIGVTPRAPGNYRIRKEPRPECLATVEAVANVLAALEDEPARFEQMLRAFAFMVDRQIERATSSVSPRRHRRPPPVTPLARLFPFVLDPSKMVLVDGAANATEQTATPGARPELVHLVACRASGERFEAFIRPRRPLGQGVPHQVGVPGPLLLGGEDVGVALARFRAFVGEGGVLGTWGSFVMDLLDNEGFQRPTSIDLRDLSARHLRRRTGGVSNAARALGVDDPGPRGSGRAGRSVGWLAVLFAQLLVLVRDPAQAEAGRGKGSQPPGPELQMPPQ